MEKYTYWFILLGSVFVPLLLSFEKNVSFYKEWKYLFPAIALTTVFFVIWDHYFTINQVWSFNDTYITGFKILNLPIEEICFFVLIPFCCAFIYYSLNYYIKKDLIHSFEDFVSYTLLAFFLLLAVLHTDQAYTFTTNLFAALLITFLKLKRVTFLSRFYLTYIVSTIPFLIVNGLLTSIPVVLYNDSENLGVRLYTIPLDDFIYSFLMLLITISLNEFFKSKFQVSAIVSKA